MLIILRPGLISIDIGAIGHCLSCTGLVAMIIIKIQSRTESSVTIVAYMGIFLGFFDFTGDVGLGALWGSNIGLDDINRPIKAYC